MVFYCEFVCLNPSIVFHNASTKWKDKLFVLKWDYFCKHVVQKKANKNIGINLKKGIGFTRKIANMANTRKLLARCSNESVVAHVANGM
jgi:hypothetical protein